MSLFLVLLAFAVSASWIPGGFAFWQAGVHPLAALPLSFVVAFLLDGALIGLAVALDELRLARAGA